MTCAVQSRSLWSQHTHTLTLAHTSIHPLNSLMSRATRGTTLSSPSQRSFSHANIDFGHEQRVLYFTPDTLSMYADIRGFSNEVLFVKQHGDDDGAHVSVQIKRNGH